VIERFIFDLYDHDSHGVLDILVVHQMFKEIYGRDFVRNYQIQRFLFSFLFSSPCPSPASLSLSLPHRALKGFTQSLRGSTTIIGADAFHSYCRRNGQILSPVTLLQNKLRILILGKEFWKRQTRNRVAICDGKYIPFPRLLQQINEGKRDRARRASLLELTFHLTHQLAHPPPPSNPPPDESPSRSSCLGLFSCWKSSSKTHPELASTVPMESGHVAASLRIALTEQQPTPPPPHEANHHQNVTESESALNQRYSKSRSKSSCFEPEEPL
jgi:hypothetical protein